MVGEEENEIKSFQQNKRVTIRKEQARLCLCLKLKKWNIRNLGKNAFKISGHFQCKN